MQRYKARAAVLSAIFMGLGQIYNRQFIKGLIFIAVEAAALFYFITNLGRAFWGITTLGESPSRLEKVKGIAKMVPGDHSIVILIESLITLLFFVLFLIVWYMNIIVFMIMLAFTNYAAPDHIPPARLVDWVGFETFRNLLVLKSWSHTFYGVLTWTIIWAVLSTITTYFGGMLVALLINQKGVRFKGMWRMILIIPYAVPQMISLLLMRNLFNGQFGPINQYLGYFGLGGLPWLTDPFWAKVTVIIVNMWVGIPVSMLLIMGVLTTIPRDMYEAAEVDGATNYQKFRIVTLPMILFSTAPTLIMQFAGNINNFNAIYLLTAGNPVNGNYQYAGSTDLLVTWLYKLTLDQNKNNMASAIGIILFIIVAGFSLYNYRRTKSFQEEDMIQ
jgi:arabinogalactan oligomer/maltooligosaccharide transport system permease protein